MTTLDETKKGLDLCGHHSHSKVCHKCPFNGTMESCIAWMASDALAHIQQLEAKCRRLEQERDAAVADLEYIANRGWDVCSRCKHDPSHKAKCKRLDETKNCFEWRGVKEE